MKLNYEIKDLKYKTVKEVLKAHFHMSDRLILKLKRNNKIWVNNILGYIYSQLNLNDILIIDLDFNEYSENIIPIKMDLNIVFEDEWILILNKPAGIPVHPSMAHYENSLSNGVNYYFKENDISTKIRPVNRLDKNTSRPCHIR